MESAKTTKQAIDSIREPTPNAATADTPYSATIAVNTAEATGVNMLAPAAGKPICKISREAEINALIDIKWL